VKICFLTSNWPPEAFAGTELVVTALARCFRARGHEVCAISGSDVLHTGTDVVEERHEGTVVHRLFKLPAEGDRQGFVRPRLLAIVRDLLARERPDVLHVHSLASLGTGITAIADELGIPSVMTFHDLFPVCARFFRLPYGGVRCPDGPDRTPCVVCVNDALQTDATLVEKALRERDALLRDEIARVRFCTAPSATTARFVREGLPYGGRIEVIPHGLLREVPPAERAEPARDGETLRLGTFGGLVREKGVVELVDAVRGLPVELHLSGRSFDRELIEEVARHESAGLRVVWRHGYTPAERHPARDLHLAVFPSKCQESYGLVVDEALAHGVPVVVSDNGAFAERAATPGVVVTPLDRLAATLRELVASRDRVERLRTAIPHDLPTIEASAERHLELYRTLP
jgi:glycosyltransferase involved in cell wall biosynthesis